MEGQSSVRIQVFRLIYSGFEPFSVGSRSMSGYFFEGSVKGGLGGKTYFIGDTRNGKLLS